MPAEILAAIDRSVQTYVAHYDKFLALTRNVDNLFRFSKELEPYIHSIKSRPKEPDHLRGKLIRKARDAIKLQEKFDIDESNILTRVNDLSGVRILHLHTDQFEKIHSIISKLLDEENYVTIEPAFARTWDDESRELFGRIGIKTNPSPSFYTSVHYVVQSNSKTKLTCEIQVRTLMEEVWGEVSHIIDYPEQTDSLACREQIKVLARVTSSATRLVDSIFRSFRDHQSRPKS